MYLLRRTVRLVFLRAYRLFIVLEYSILIIIIYSLFIWLSLVFQAAGRPRRFTRARLPGRDPRGDPRTGTPAVARFRSSAQACRLKNNPTKQQKIKIKRLKIKPFKQTQSLQTFF